MHHTVEEVQDNQNGSGNAVVEDSTAMTMEYLRARLHSERLVSKAARERANELAKQVTELKEQVKVISVQRKKAEQATLDVLALLENHGISEISDEYNSDSGMEESLYDPNVDKGNSVDEEESFVNSKQKEGLSGSECESTPSTARSLSWKSSKDSPRSCERRYFDPSIRKRSNFVQSASSRHRVGKSCRQIKRRETRSIVEESRHVSKSPGVHFSDAVDHSICISNGLDSRQEEPRNCSENNVKKTLLNAQILVSSEAEGHVSGTSISVQKHTCGAEMERALQHQAHFIGRYEAEEKAQKEWEEKYMGNGYIMPDSCEPGNQSDVTEERDVTEEKNKTKALVPSPSEVVAPNSNCHKSKEESICFGKGSCITHINSFKFSTHSPIESSHNSKVNEAHCCRTAASDFAFPVVKETHVPTDSRVTDSPAQSSLSQPLCDSTYSHTVTSIDNGANYCQVEKTNHTRSKEYAIVPHEAPQKLGGVLDALHQAKQLLKQNINRLPSLDPESVGNTAEISVSEIGDVERMKMAVGSARLFRVPTYFHFEASGPRTTLQGSSYSLHSTQLSYSMEPRPSSSNLDRFFSSIPASSDSQISSSKPWYATSLPSSSAFTFSSNSPHPDFAPRLSNGELFTVQSPSSTSGLPLSGHPFFYNDHIRPNK